MSTEELIVLCIKRDDLAWNEFIMRYQGLVSKAVYYKLNRMNARHMRSESDDIVQEIFLALWEGNKLSNIKDMSKINSWLFVVSVNNVVSYCRRRWRKTGAERCLSEPVSDDGVHTLEDVIVSTVPNPVEEYEANETMEFIDNCLDKLKERERRVLKERMYEGRKQQDIADDMGIPVGTVGGLICRGKRKIRQELMELCA